MAPGGGPRVEAPLAAGRPTPAAAASEGNASALQPATLMAETDGSSTEATVYEWSPGAGREEPRVVWIVDRGLDI